MRREKSISPGQKASGRPHRPPAVVHARLLLGRELREGATERRGEEEGVVAEAARPAPRVGGHAPGAPPRRVLPAPPLPQGGGPTGTRPPPPRRGGPGRGPGTG